MNLTFWLLIGFTGFVALVQIIYYLFVFSKFAFHKPKIQQAAEPSPISVIISAKNELKNLKEFLPLVLNQNYPDFEVIVVNEGSWDDTGEYMEELVKTTPRLRLVDVKVDEKYQRGKKLALTLGIKAATHEWMLFTDADCKPLSEYWLLEMSKAMTDDKEIVLGYSRYKKRNSFLNLFIRWETFYSAMQYFSYAIIGRAYMGVGRNMAYRKSLFFRVKGFASHQHILAGDDDLFVNETANAKNVAVVYSYNSFTESMPKLSWGAWWKQKKRHFYVGKFYKKSDKRRLGFFNTCHILLYPGLLATLLLFPQYWYFPAGVYALRAIVQSLVIVNAMNKLKISKLFGLTFLFDILLVPYYLTVGLSGLTAKKLKWH